MYLRAISSYCLLTLSMHALDNCPAKHSIREVCLWRINIILEVFPSCMTDCAAFVIIWIRYRHIKGHYADSPAKLQLLNVLSFLVGFLSIFGLLLVSSFQVSTFVQYHYPHNGWIEWPNAHTLCHMSHSWYYSYKMHAIHGACDTVLLCILYKYAIMSHVCW